MYVSSFRWFPKTVSFFRTTQGRQCDSSRVWRVHGLVGVRGRTVSRVDRGPLKFSEVSSLPL